MKILSLLGTFLLIANMLVAQTIVINNTRTPAHVPLPKNKLSLIPPPNYLPLPNDAGFFLNGTSPDNGDEQIKVSKFFLDFPTVRDGLLSSAPGHTAVKINNYDGIWIKSTENVEGSVFTSLTLCFGNAAYSYVIIGEFPSTSTTIEAKLQAAVRSAYVDTFGYSNVTARVRNQARRFEQAASTFNERVRSKFRVDLSGTDYKPAEIISDDHIIYTLDGAYPPVAADKSKIEIKNVGSTVSESSWATYSTQVLGSNSDFHTVSGATSNAVEVNGLKGIEIVANAIYASPAKPVKVYQMTLFETNSVYTITGISYQNAPEMIEVIRKIAKTFTITP